ncbi:hypothetical protein FB45DRAFT_215666 [Roridomyces roridus]|uniref:MYND-type domain-containing protein n=1 Tax=Roridomyces roridus TaxID=1738132 RepID=A0AAD7FGU1_9AGAR|nr:hypothetical protein FB45DRAFT_215666 [Roridomyces roridus]
MMSEPLVVCICGEPAANRCSSCKAVSYCSKECQRGDWKTHKIACKAATSVASSSSPSDVPSPTSLRRGSPTDLQQLIRVGAQHSIYQDTLQLGLEPDLISGVTGAEFYDEKDGSAKFWRLDGSVREEWENNARVDHRKAQRFWKTFLSPITDARKWVDIVLDAVLNVRLPSNNQPMWQTQVNANILAGLFPHLRHFTREQNTALLDIFVRHGPWYDHTGCFRLSSGTTVFELDAPI